MSRTRSFLLLLVSLVLLAPACGESSSAGPAHGSSGDARDAANDDHGATAPDAPPKDAPPPDAPPPDAPAEDAAEVVAPPPDLSEPLPEGKARAGIITNSAELIGGPKADGRLGDVKIYNARVAFVIEGVRKADGYRVWGGHVVDADVVRPAGEPGRDVFGELFHTWNTDIFQPETVEVVSDGTQGGPAHVRVTGKNVPMHFARVVVGALFASAPTRMRIVYEYILEPDATALLQRVTVTNLDVVAADIDFPVIFNSQGDGLRQWAPGHGFVPTEGEVDSLRLATRDLSYRLTPSAGVALTCLFDYSNVFLTLADGFALEPGASNTREWVLHVSDNGPDGLGGLPAAGGLGSLEGTVLLPKTTSWREAYVVAWSGQSPASLAPVRQEGTFRMSLPAGQYVLTPYAPAHAAGEGVDVLVVEAEVAAAALAIPAAATVTAKVSDAGGAPVSARVVLRAAGDTPSPYPPSSVRVALEGEWSWSAGNKVSAVGYAVGGETTVLVPAGEYTVTASRGFSYEYDERSGLTVAEGGEAELELTVTRVVDTVGWVSGDFHIHAARSPDSAVPYEVRVRQAITEDLDVPVLTEHEMVSGLQPTADELLLGDEIAGVAGNEVTTFAFGHFNAFPLLWDPEAVNGGAVFPHDKDPHELLQAIRDQHPGDEIIQVNHPRGADMGSYFSFVGYDPENGSAYDPSGFSLDWDAVEVFNGHCGGSSNLEALADWVGMTNHGLRRTLSSGSDSHSERSPIGLPRNWIRVDLAELQKDHQSLVAPVRERRMIVSCGPFVVFETADGLYGLGDLAPVDTGGKVAFRAEVQAPGWMALTELRFWRNGQVVDVLPIEEAASGVRLDAQLEDHPEADAWYAVEVVGSGSLFPVYFSGTPYALTNPIEADADGDGVWTPPSE